jgi:hypothetical protein
MYTIDSLPTPYFEERSAAEAAQRAQEQNAKAQAISVAAALKASSSQHGGSEARAQKLLQHQRPPLSRPVSTGGGGVLGNIFQGFVRTTSQSPPPSGSKGAASGSSTPVTTPPAKVVTQADLERMMAEQQKKHVDYIGSSPGWW